MTTKALVAFATKYGSTAEIAASIADTLRASGIDVDLRAARQVKDVEGYDVVVLGSGVYVNRWHGEALDFAKRFANGLRQRSTWFFSSGPTGGTPKAEVAMADILRTQGPPPGQARKLAEQIGILGHKTFAGKIGENMGGFFARWIPKGDWRDFTAISQWASAIAGASRSNGNRSEADAVRKEPSAVIP
jgi:menaquinone-dependent protoporphyrinogen oxidase